MYYYRIWFYSFRNGKKVRNRIFFERGFRNLSSICYIKNKIASTQCHTVWKGIVSSLKVSFFWKSGTRCSSPDIAAATSVPLLWFSLRFSSIFIGPLCLRRLIGNKKNSMITAMKTKIESAKMKKKIIDCSNLSSIILLIILLMTQIGGKYSQSIP